MKGRSGKIIGILSIGLVLILALTSWAQPVASTEPARQVSVTGDAEVRVVPDEALLSLGVETWDKNLAAAQQENQEIVTGLLAVAEEYGIASEHVQTEFVSIEPRYRNGYYEDRDFIGYFVQRTIVITLRDLSKFEVLLGGALGAGANYVYGVEFRTTELRKYKDKARALAIQAAQEKAEALAGELGQKLGAPTSIEEIQATWASSYGGWWGRPWSSAVAQNVVQELGGGAPGGQGSLAPGQISVKAQVAVSFEMTR